jgi:hypothetical protein
MWVYVGLGWEQKELDGNKGRLMGPIETWWEQKEFNWKLMGPIETWWEQKEFNWNLIGTKGF